MSTLLRSQIECPECGELIASIHRHDFRSCSCGKTSLDGGRDYMRLLVDNGLVERKALRNGRRPSYGWRPKVQLANHPEVP